MNIKAPKGTKDILPEEIESWQNIEKIASDIFSKANFKEIRTPIFEDTDLFERGVGDTTDIVNKEMYTFIKSDRSLTLRPENTAGVVRAYLEHNFYRESPPVKLWYKGSMFRYERPQAGRQRQFHQIGVEMFGIQDASADAECILLATEFLKALGLNDLVVEINSLGCNTCRKEYKEQLKTAIAPFLDDLCEDCKSRYEKNPLRILDCKNETCNKLFEEYNLKNAVSGVKLCDECAEHYKNLKSYLDILNIKYKENTFLVRGLDYYTKTVFEIKSNNLGSQNAVCGGGRYDGLVETLGGVHTPAVGWAMGVERLNSLIPQIKPSKIDYFIVSDNKSAAIQLTADLRKHGFSAEFDYSSRKFAKQLEKASKIAEYAIILGEDEIKNKYLTVKNLYESTQEKIALEEIYNRK
ncbi:MAG: histidine--tRNA ligase [Candidatus Gastranaerophilales bacterium]|nr:histidine--tRNA ligase [Candidatus Gastranaerophilales bacterium]